MSGLVTIRKSPARSIFPPERRPTKRSECPKSRPCPWYGCRYHLASDEHTDGTVRVEQIAIETDDAPEREETRSENRPTCALDLAGQRMPDGRPRAMDIEEIAAVTGLWHTNVEDALASGLAKLGASPELADAWAELVSREEFGHPLAQAQRLADPAEELIGGRPMGKARNA